MLGEYAIDFMKTGKPSVRVQERLKLFHTDAMMCAISALAMKTNSPTILYKQARKRQTSGAVTKAKEGFAKVFGSPNSVPVEFAVAANVAAAGEW